MKRLSLIFAAALTLVSIANAKGAEPEASKPNYELAERFSPTKVRRVVPQTEVRPNWFKNSSKFWYSWKSIDGTNFYIVDPATGKQSELWSMAELAEKVTLATNYPFDAQHTPVENIELDRKSVV